MQARRYRFGPLDRSGVLAGLRTGQLVAIGTGGVLAVWALRTFGSWGSLGMAMTFAAVAVIVSFWPIGGRTIEQWVPVLLSWMASKVTGRNRFTTSAPVSGRTSRLEPQPDFPPVLRSIEILSGAAPGNPQGIGVIKDKAFGSYTAVLAAKGRSFALLDQPEKSRRLQSWASVLAGLAREGSLVHRIQWIERTVPDEGHEVRSYLISQATAAEGSDARTSYVDLIEEAGPVTQQHEVLLALSIDVRRAGRAIKLQGGGDTGACEVLRKELTALASRLQGSEIMVSGALTPRLVAKAIATGFDPFKGRQVSSNGNDHGGVPIHLAAPAAAEAEWSCFRSDGAWHATYWIAEWPRVEVDADFLAPLLLRTDAMRTISVVMEPVSPLRAIREVEHDRTSAMADEELRRRVGFLTTARRRREQEALNEREEELASGHAELRFSGYLTVTAKTKEELELACGEVEQTAGQSYLDIRRLYGEQDLVFSYTLPLARGLR